MVWFDLLDFVAKQLPDVLLLDHRFDCSVEMKCSQCLCKMNEWMVRWKVKWCDLIYLILLQSSCQMFCSLSTIARCSAPNLIVPELKCSQCLCKMSEWMVRWKVKWYDLIYLILLQSSCQMFCSLSTDLIVREIKCSQCLCKIVNEWLDGK